MDEDDAWDPPVRIGPTIGPAVELSGVSMTVSTAAGARSWEDQWARTLRVRTA